MPANLVSCSTCGKTLTALEIEAGMSLNCRPCNCPTDESANGKGRRPPRRAPALRLRWRETGVGAFRPATCWAAAR